MEHKFKKIFKIILEEIKYNSAIVFLIISAIIVLLFMNISEKYENLEIVEDKYEEYDVRIDGPAIILIRGVEENTKKEIDSKVYNIMMDYNIKSYKLLLTDDSFIYEIYNSDINDKYRKENPALESNVLDIYNKIKNVLNEFNVLHNLEISVVNYVEDRTYFSIINGEISFSIYDIQEHYHEGDKDENWKYL